MILDYLSKILLKGKIPAPEFKRISELNSPVENVIQALSGESKDANLQSLRLSLLKNYLPSKIPLGKAFENLIRFLSSLPKSELTPQTKEALMTTMKSLSLQGEKVDENLLKNFIAKTGLNYEADLKKLGLSKLEGHAGNDQSPESLKESLKSSLKGQLIKIIQELETKLSSIRQEQNQPQLKELQALLKNIKATLSNLELNQILNYYSKQEDGFLQFQIPFSASETVNLYIKDNSKKNDQKGSKQKEDVNLIFDLKLKAMGNLRIDVQMLDQSLNCKFYAEDEEVSKFISSMLPELEGQLEKKYGVNHLSCIAKDKSFFEDNIPEKKLFQGKTQIINVEA